MQDFIADPLNPNVDGLLENIMRSCRVVIDQDGNEIFPSIIGSGAQVSHRECGSGGVHPSSSVLLRLFNAFFAVTKWNQK